MSTPCKYKTGIYTRYNQTEMFEVSCLVSTRHCLKAILQQDDALAMKEPQLS